VSFFAELKHRNVFRVAMAYAIGSWLIAQIADLVLDSTSAPDWIMQVLFLMLAIGFVVALVISWAYEITPDGIKRERDVIRDESITHLTAKKLDYITLAAAAGVVVMFVWQQDDTKQGPEDEISDTTGTTNASIPAVAGLGAQSIAVLPFANRSNQDDDLFFTDGIHDDLLTQLAKISDLKVVSRTSVMEYRNTTKKIPEIASELGVATILEGGVQRAGQRIRINAQLIDVATDQHLWAETYDREMTIDNLFDIQSEITQHIVAAVKGQISSADQSAIARAPTESVAAYDVYLKARQRLSSSGYNVEKYQAAQPLLERSVELDPDFGLAWLLLAEVHSYAAWMGYGDFPARQAEARAALDRAAAVLGPDAPELLVAQGNYLYRFERDYAGALEVQTRAAAQMPGNVKLLHDMGASQRRMGLFDESITSLLVANELDPASPEAAGTAASTMVFNREYDRAEIFLQSARQRHPLDTDIAAIDSFLPILVRGDTKIARQRLDRVRPNAGLQYVQAITELPWFERDFVAAIEVWDLPEVRTLTAVDGWHGWPELYRAMAWRELGDDKRASALLEEVVSRDIDLSMAPTNLGAELTGRSWALALLGDFEGAIADAEEAVRLQPYETDRLEGSYPLQSLCYVLALVGRRDEALAMMPMLLEVPNGFAKWWLYLDPRWDFMRDDERFNDLVRPDNLEQSIHATKKKRPAFVQ
jgi:TolB-like protein